MKGAAGEKGIYWIDENVITWWDIVIYKYNINTFNMQFNVLQSYGIRLPSFDDHIEYPFTIDYTEIQEKKKPHQ